MQTGEWQRDTFFNVTRDKCGKSFDPKQPPSLLGGIPAPSPHPDGLDPGSKTRVLLHDVRQGRHDAFGDTDEPGLPDQRRIFVVVSTAGFYLSHASLM